MYFWGAFHCCENIGTSWIIYESSISHSSSIFQLQAALEKEQNLEQNVDDDSGDQEALLIDNSGHLSESLTSLTSQLNEVTVCGDSSIVTPTSETVEGSDPAGSGQDIDKRIRALKKKVSELFFPTFCIRLVWSLL